MSACPAVIGTPTQDAPPIVVVVVGGRVVVVGDRVVVVGGEVVVVGCVVAVVVVGGVVTPGPLCLGCPFAVRSATTPSRRVLICVARAPPSARRSLKEMALPPK